MIKPQAEKEREIAVPPGAPASPRFLRFECPACFAMLNVGLNAGYDGGPAPCPLCGQHVTAPRIAAGRINAPAMHATPAPQREGFFRPDRQRADFRFVEGRLRRVEER